MDVNNIPDGMDLGDETANAFLTDLLGGEDEKKATSPEPKADDKPAEETPEVDDEGTEEAGEGDEEGSSEEQSDPDDAEVDLGDAKAKLRDLKAAYKAQAEVTAAREAVAKERFQATSQTNLAKLALGKAVEKAEARWKTYEGLDFMALSRDPSIDNDTFAAIRKEAAEALADVRFYREELDGVVQAETRQTQATTQAEAAKTVQALSNPETGIKGWNQQMYNDLLAYAESVGAPRDGIRALTAEWPLRLMHKAMMYDRGVKAAASQMEKVVNKPTRVLSSSKGDGKPNPGSATKSAMAALRKSGDVDDAANAFLASFGVDD